MLNEDVEAMISVDPSVVLSKRKLWQGCAAAQRAVEQAEVPQGPIHLKNNVETDIAARYLLGPRVLDVGIGAGRVSIPLLRYDIRLTGVDTSAAMIERCRTDPRATAIRLVHGEMEDLPFAREAFDTVLSIDTFGHYPQWAANLDELLRVTALGGRIIVDVGSQDHVEAVASARGRTADEVCAAERADAQAFVLRLSVAELRAYAVGRGISLAAVAPYGVVFGELVPNHWFSASYAYRSGALDRLVSWTAADARLAAFAEFIERRIVQQLPVSVSGRMFAIFERRPQSVEQVEADISNVPLRDERGADAWGAEFVAHLEHEPNLTFAVALVLAARPARLPEGVRRSLPERLERELGRAQRAFDIDDACGEVVSAWRKEANELTFHGIHLGGAIAPSLARALRDCLQPGT